MTVAPRLRSGSRACVCVALLASLAGAGCGRSEAPAGAAPPAADAAASSPGSDVNTITAMTARFAPVELSAEILHSPVPRGADEGTFYAWWRRENPTAIGQPYTLLQFFFFEIRCIGDRVCKYFIKTI